MHFISMLSSFLLATQAANVLASPAAKPPTAGDSNPDAIEMTPQGTQGKAPELPQSGGSSTGLAQQPERGNSEAQRGDPSISLAEQGIDQTCPNPGNAVVEAPPVELRTLADILDRYSIVWKTVGWK